MKRAICVILILVAILAMVQAACIILDDPGTVNEQATRMAATSAKESTQVGEAVRMTQTAEAKAATPSP